MTRLTEELLARYYDRELSSKESEEVERLLAASPEHQAELKRIELVGTLMREALSDSLQDVSFSGFWDRVRTGITNDKGPGFFDRMTVWLSEFVAHRKVVWVPMTAMAGAAAIIVFALLVSQGAPSPGASSAPVSKNGEFVLSGYFGHGSHIEKVRFGSLHGETYQLSGPDNSAIGVVWINEP